MSEQKVIVVHKTDESLERIAVAVEKIADYLVNKDKKQILDSVDMLQDIVNRIRKNNCDDCDITQTQLEDMIDALKAGIKEKYGDVPFYAQSKGNDSGVWQCPAGRQTCEMNNCNSCEHLAYLLRCESENDGAK